MSFLDLFKKTDINKGVCECKKQRGILLDVRTEEEYACGKIPESVNIPLQNITFAEHMLPDKGASIFVYCQSGARSMYAAGFLRSKGYAKVENIGGIEDYDGEII